MTNKVINAQIIENILQDITDENLYSKAFDLFDLMGYYFDERFSDVNLSSQDFIEKYGSNKMTTWNEKKDLDSTKNISVIRNEFSDYSIYMNPPSEYIYYVTGVLNCNTHSRSEIAEIATRAISNILEHPFIIFFKCNENVLFGTCIADNEGKKIVYLSSWYNCARPEITDLFEIQNINVENMKNQSVEGFLYDFVYFMARDYYLFPESNYYQKYGFLSRKYTNDEIALEICPPNYNIEQEMTSYKDVYGYDYVNNEEETDESVEERGIQEQLIRELIEESYLLELDEDEKTDNDEYSDYDKDTYDEKEDDLSDEFDDKKNYDDPLEILKIIGKSK